jgi:hydrogenase maturation protease
MTPAPRLVFAIGNASRGDDALGPLLGETLRAEGCFDGGNAELLDAYQLQIEDALQLCERQAVLFIDAARHGGPTCDAANGVVLGPVAPAASATPFSHALAPSALLEVFRRVTGLEPPPASVLAIEGAQFELGAALSDEARSRIAPAAALARDWLAGTPAQSAVSR